MRSAGLGAGTFCGDGCWPVSLIAGVGKSSCSEVPTVLTTGSFLVTSNVLSSTEGTFRGFSPTLSALFVFCEPAPPPELPSASDFAISGCSESEMFGRSRARPNLKES